MTCPDTNLVDVFGSEADMCGAQLMSALLLNATVKADVRKRLCALYTQRNGSDVADVIGGVSETWQPRHRARIELTG